MRCLVLWWIGVGCSVAARRCCGLSRPDGGQVIACDLRYPVDGEPELDEQLCQRRRRPECVHADYGAVITDVTLPAQCGGLPHGDACGHRRRQHFVAVLPGLAIEQFPAAHAHYAGTDAVGLQFLAGGQRQTNFRTRCQQNGLG
jgi:hypothetical protein